MRHASAIFVASVCLVMTGAQAAVDQRVEWQYETDFGTRRFVSVGDGQWMHYFANGNSFPHVEIERTDDYVALRNSENGNVQRLFSDRGTLQKAGAGNFGRFAVGQWVPSTAPDTSLYEVTVVYFVPRDRTPVPGYEQKIRAVVDLTSEMFTEALKASGAETQGPQFAQDQSGELKVVLVRGPKDARAYSGLPGQESPDHARLVAEAVETELGDTRRYAALIFSETYETGPAGKLFPGVTNVTLARPPFGGRVVVTSWMLQDEFCGASPQELRQLFFDRTPISGRSTFGVNAPNAARGEFMEEAYGAIVHEMGHLFGCWHHRSAATNIMGGGFRDIRWNVGLKRNSRAQARFSRENAWLLMTSRFLNPLVNRTDNTKPELDVQTTNSREAIAATLNVRDDKGLAFACVVDESAADGLIMLDAQRLSGAEQQLTFRIAKRDLKSQQSRLMFVAVDTGGNFRRVSRSPAAAN